MEFLVSQMDCLSFFIYCETLWLIKTPGDYFSFLGLTFTFFSFFPWLWNFQEVRILLWKLQNVRFPRFGFQWMHFTESAWHWAYWAPRQYRLDSSYWYKLIILLPNYHFLHKITSLMISYCSIVPVFCKSVWTSCCCGKEAMPVLLQALAYKKQACDKWTTC